MHFFFFSALCHKASTNLKKRRRTNAPARFILQFTKRLQKNIEPKLSSLHVYVSVCWLACLLIGLLIVLLNSRSQAVLRENTVTRRPSLRRGGTELPKIQSSKMHTEYYQTQTQIQESHPPKCALSTTKPKPTYKSPILQNAH